MKVQYPVVKQITVDKDIKFNIDYSTGEIVGIIPGNDKTPDKLLVIDDKSGAFIKVNVSECYKVD